MERWERKAADRDRKRRRRRSLPMVVTGRSTKTLLPRVIADKAKKARRPADG